LAAVVGQPFSVGVIFERMFMLTTFDQRQFFIIDSPMWCLAVFFQLYLIFLPLRKLIVRVGPISLLPLAAIGFAARWIAGLPSVVRWDEFFGHTMVFNWLFVFGLGIWIGTKLRQDGEIRFPLWTVSALPLAATGVLILSEKFHSVYPIHDSVIGLVMGVVAFYVWQAARGTPVASVLAVVGAISFPLYLYHRPLVSYATNIWCLAPSIDRMPPLQLGIFLVPAILLLFLMIPRIVYFRKQAFAMIFALLSLH
jgi:peptidoglycan/LPS O-acetylase OafA/YrhL